MSDDLEIVLGALPHALRRCLEDGQRRRYPANANIVSEGEHSNSLFYIISGSVSVVMDDPEGHEIVLAYLHQGDFFGEIGLFDERQQRSAWVRAREPSDVVQLGYERIRNLCNERPEVVYQLLAQMSKRIRDTNRKLEALAFMDVSGRIARTLLELCQEPEAIPTETGHRIRITRRELGRLVGCSREMASRVLRSMEEKSAIALKGREIIVPSAATPAYSCKYAHPGH